MQIEIYTGGLLETNAYYLPEAKVLIDAPQGIAEVMIKKSWTVEHLFFTHGHFDHIWDGAKIKKLAQCDVRYHQADEVMFLQPDLWASYGIEEKFERIVANDFFVDGKSLKVGSFEFQILHVPGHSPGSVCFYEAKEKVLFGGDVLFRGGVGRWDLPGGSQDVLLTGIRDKLLIMPEEVVVYPGHGPFTQIGWEKASNPYLQD